MTWHLARLNRSFCPGPTWPFLTALRQLTRDGLLVGVSVARIQRLDRFFLSPFRLVTVRPPQDRVTIPLFLAVRSCYALILPRGGGGILHGFLAVNYSKYSTAKNVAAACTRGAVVHGGWNKRMLIRRRRGHADWESGEPGG